MQIVIIGGGEVGANIARTLTGERQSVTVLERDPVRAEALRSSLDAMVVIANGSSPHALREHGAKHADLVVAATESDETNVLAAMAAHHLGAKRTVARVRDRQYFGPDESYAHDVMGIDFVINPDRATADDISDAVLLPGAVQVEYFADGHVAVAETVITDRSPAVGFPLRNREMICPHYIVGLVRDGQAQVVDGSERMQPGDHVLLVASRDKVAETVAHLAGHAHAVEHVVVFGAGRIGMGVAGRLERCGLRPLVLERDAERARQAAERLPDCMVIQEEGVSKEALLNHYIDRADAFIACSGDDRTNLLAAMHAKQLGADLCLPVISREEFVPLVDAMGLDAGFSPRLTTAEAILRYLRRDNVRAIHLLLSGAEILELQIQAGSKACGQGVRQIKLPGQCIIGALVRDGDLLFPRPDLRLQAGDTVLLFGLQGATSKAERAFSA